MRDTCIIIFWGVLSNCENGKESHNTANWNISPDPPFWGLRRRPAARARVLWPGLREVVVSLRVLGLTPHNPSRECTLARLGNSRRAVGRCLARHQIAGNNPQSASGGVSKVQLLCEYNPSLLFLVFEKKMKKVELSMLRWDPQQTFFDEVGVWRAIRSIEINPQ